MGALWEGGVQGAKRARAELPGGRGCSPEHLPLPQAAWGSAGADRGEGMSASLRVGRLMLTSPSAPFGLAQGKLRVGGVPRTGQNAGGGLFGGPGCWVGVEGGETW